MTIGFAISAHNTKVMLGMLGGILGSDAVAAGQSLARQYYISLENLIGVAANLAIRAIAFLSLDSMGHPLSVIV
jgi:hypothetical protein